MKKAYVNARIWTVNDSQPWASAMLVEGDIIRTVGSSEEIKSVIDNDTTVVDLGGCMVIPGLHDAHTHLIWAAQRQLGYQCELHDPMTLEELADQLRAYWKEHSDRGWLVAAIYNPIVLNGEVLTKEWLDSVIPGVPIYIHDFSIHNVMANGAALAAAGVNRNTPDPFGGTIVRDEDGEPTGKLMEYAQAFVAMAAPPLTPEENIEALRLAVKICNEFGITSVQEASARRGFLQAAKALDDRNELNLDIKCHIPWGSPLLANCHKPEQEKLIGDRKQYQSRRVDVDGIKVAMDGTSIAPIFSHVPLDPVTDQPIIYNLLLDPSELAEKISEWTAEGMIVKTHCTGYGSARIGLDTYEKSSPQLKKAEQMHDIAHAHYISPRDRSRFAELGVVAEMSPAIWHIPLYKEVLGRSFDFRTLHEHGATMTIGSDWVLTPDPNLFPALAGLMEHGEESISLELGVRLMTLNGAVAVGQAHRTGSLEVGKEATFIVLDRHIFDLPVDEVAKTRVLRTVLQGDEVYLNETVR